VGAISAQTVREAGWEDSHVCCKQLVCETGVSGLGLTSGDLFFFIDVVGICWLLEEEDSLFGGGEGVGEGMSEHVPSIQRL